MKIEYEFVTGKVEIEVPEEWGLVHKEMNRLEENNNHTETRRHDSMDMLADEYGVQFADPNVKQWDDDYGFEEKLKVLRPEQRQLLRRIFVNGETMADIARAEGVCQMSIHERFQRALKKISKNCL